MRNRSAYASLTLALRRSGIPMPLLTLVPLIPLPPVLWRFMFVNDGLKALVSEIPWLVVFWIVPPELSPPSDELAPTSPSAWHKP